MKVHEKYVIEIEEIIRGYRNPPDQEDILRVNPPYARIKGFNTLFFDQHGLDKLVPLEHELEVIKAEELKKAYNDAQTIAQLPSAQPELIRCKDCKHYKTEFCAIDIWTADVKIYKAKPDDFCSRAERRQDEQNSDDGV